MAKIIGRPVNNNATKPPKFLVRFTILLAASPASLNQERGFHQSAAWAHTGENKIISARKAKTKEEFFVIRDEAIN